LVSVNDLINTFEFKQLATNYRYLKIQKFVITIPPTTNAIKLYSLLRWTDDIGNSHIENDDNTKIVQTNTVRYQFVKYKPPDLQMGNSSALLPMFNYKSWCTIDDLFNTNIYRVPGTILLKADGGSITIKISARCIFRGSKVPDENKLMELVNEIKQLPKTEYKKIQPNKVVELIKDINNEINDINNNNNININTQPLHTKCVKGQKIVTQKQNIEKTVDHKQLLQKYHKDEKAVDDTNKKSLDYEFDDTLPERWPIKVDDCSRPELTTTRQVAEALINIAKLPINKIESLCAIAVDDYDEYGQPSDSFLNVFRDSFTSKETSKIFDTFIEHASELVKECKKIKA
jgi:hypothetical protein